MTTVRQVFNCRQRLFSSLAKSIKQQTSPDHNPLENEFIDCTKDPRFPIKDISVIPEFISELEEQRLLETIELRLRRLKYSNSHFDKVIDGYRELAISDCQSVSTLLFETVERMKSTIVKEHQVPLKNWKPLHVLDLSSTGSIGSHVDNVDYSGETVSALCLQSPAVMTLRPAISSNDDDDYCLATHVLLPRRCLYITSGKVRFEYRHEIKSSPERMYSFKGHHQFPQQRRISLILRDNK